MAGIYGVVHDQITYSISKEYFTRFKFIQFYYAEPASGSEREFAGRIGFLASWWVGALTAWVIARISLKQNGELPNWRKMAKGFLMVFATSALVAAGGGFFGEWKTGSGGAVEKVESLGFVGIEDAASFLIVGYIHNGSYIGGVLGTILAIIFLLRCRLMLGESP